MNSVSYLLPGNHHGTESWGDPNRWLILLFKNSSKCLSSTRHGHLPGWAQREMAVCSASSNPGGWPPRPVAPSPPRPVKGALQVGECASSIPALLLRSAWAHSSRRAAPFPWLQQACSLACAFGSQVTMTTSTPSPWLLHPSLLVSPGNSSFTSRVFLQLSQFCNRTVTNSEQNEDLRM